MICTRFKGVRNTTPEKIQDLFTVLEEIKSEKYRIPVEEIRKQENPSKTPLKEKLPCFTPTGNFSYRSIAGLVQYNGLICLDIDNVESPENLKEQCKKLDWVYSAFITPSGKGLKVLVKTSSDVENYKSTELKVSEKFKEETGFSRDNHCKDIARIQFVSYDPEIYINEESKIF